MKILHGAGKWISAFLFSLSLVVILLNFNRMFPALNHNALALTETSEDDPINIPVSINFLSEDRKAFIDYCKGIYGEDLPMSIEPDSFIYYGTIDGCRLYRMQVSAIPAEPAHQTETIGNYIFESDCLYRPSRTGLYIIGDGGVYSLDQAVEYNMINVDEAYRLYQQKMQALVSVPKTQK